MKFNQFMKTGSYVLASLLITTNALAQDTTQSKHELVENAAIHSNHSNDKNLSKELPYEEFSPTMKMKIEDMEQQMKEEALARMKKIQPANQEKKVKLSY